MHALLTAHQKHWLGYHSEDETLPANGQCALRVSPSSQAGEAALGAHGNKNNNTQLEKEFIWRAIERESGNQLECGEEIGKE